MTAGGKLTADMGRKLDAWLAPKGYDVFFDHGNKEKGNVGTVVSWFGKGHFPAQATEFAQLDIAVAMRLAGHTHATALIEIEESNDRPKNILGNLLCTLMGDHVSFNHEELTLDEKTTLIVIANGPHPHDQRLQRLVENVKAAKSSLVGRNKEIGNIVAALFTDERDLELKLTELVQHAVGTR